MLKRLSKLFSELGWLVVIFILASPHVPRWTAILLIVLSSISIVATVTTIVRKTKR